MSVAVPSFAWCLAVTTEPMTEGTGGFTPWQCHMTRPAFSLSQFPPHFYEGHMAPRSNGFRNQQHQQYSGLD
eukprot:2267992-Amphidinium_carterae.1